MKNNQLMIRLRFVGTVQRTPPSAVTPVLSPLHYNEVRPPNRPPA
ncbi:MAG: hypothetical protein ACLP50_31250 [Solirubrobacteraceae bacterium]